MKPVIRKGNSKDLDALVALENECFLTDRISKDSYYRFINSSKTAEILVVANSSQIIGSAIILFRKNSKKARLYSLAVRKPFRKKGIAHRLMLQIEKNAKNRGSESLILEVRTDNHRAIKFYKKHHYKTFANYAKFFEDGCNALRMVKPL